MRAALLLFLGLCLGQAYANINFNPFSHQQPCNPEETFHKECMRGQICSLNSKCVSHTSSPYAESIQGRPLRRLVSRALSLDGKCGPANGGTTCDPNSANYKGSCCSPFGWCGDSDAHCGAGCQSGPCTKVDGTKPRSDGQCGSGFGGAPCDPNGEFGGCCSSAGWCGKTAAHCDKAQGCQSGCTTGGGGGTGTTPPTPSSSQAEPVLGAPTNAPPTGATTRDGTCGADNGNTVCGNWVQGGCCSMYGFCGDTTAHCGNGCQSGPCLGPAVIPAPGPSPAPAATVPGSLKVVGQAGVPAMHAGLLQNGRVVFLDKVENYSQLKLANGQFAYSAEYDPATNKVVGLGYKTNAFCSGGAFLADGRFVSIGGNAPLEFIDPTVGDGFKAVRYLSRSSTDASKNGQDWSEPGNKIASARWYASVQTMPDSTLFVASGSLNGLDPSVKENNNPTYEILNAQGITNGKNIPMEILNSNQPYYMYPFIHLLNDGNLFVFVSKSAEIFNVGTNTVVKSLPDLPGDHRTYPNTGGSVLLPLRSANGYAPDILICGGGAYQDITSPTDASCGRIQPLATNPGWELESMPEGRGMVEGTLLPDGTVIWVNGCNTGAQGFGIAKNPTLEVLIYDPAKPVGQRFTTGPRSDIARLYHSVAVLLLDGTLMIAGSNPVEQPVLKPVPNQTPSEDFVTEFRVEIYTPPYLSRAGAVRPTGITLSSKTLKADGSKFTIKFTATAGVKAVTVSLYHGGFVTHSLHMNHRMIVLNHTGFKAGTAAQRLTVTMPPNHNVAHPGPYVIYVCADGTPGIGQFVSVT
ncbi:hypothetical protein MMC29_006988 [Sticta canariensis]|nr:hypothetical protein [Sticta canariensis]